VFLWQRYSSVWAGYESMGVGGEVEWRSIYSWQKGPWCPFNEAGQASAPVLMFQKKEMFLVPAGCEIFHLWTAPLSFRCVTCLAGVDGLAFT